MRKKEVYDFKKEIAEILTKALHELDLSDYEKLLEGVEEILEGQRN